MYNFSGGEVPRAVIDGVKQLTSLSQESISNITENILKYLTGVGGVNKEAMAEAVTEFASMAGMEIGEAQSFVKVLLNILKASYRGGLAAAQLAEDFHKLTGSVKAAEPIVLLWSKYIQSDTDPEIVSTVSEAGGRQPGTAPASTADTQSVTAAEDSAARVIRSTGESPVGVTADGDDLPASFDDVLEGTGVCAFDELQDIRWMFGVTAASSEPASVGSTFVRLALRVQSPEGRPAVRHVQLTVSQFYSLLHQLERARAEARFM